MLPRHPIDFTLDAGGAGNPPIQWRFEEIDEVEFDQSELKSNVGGLVKSFARKAA